MKNLNSIVGIITYHKSLSYGACLQAIATQECVRKLMNSDEVYLIDYVNEYEARQKSWQFIFKGTIKEIAATMIKRVLFRKRCIIARFVATNFS